MTADEFRDLALSFPEAVESAHMDHPDFRVRNKIFATLGPEEAWGMVKLPPSLQSSFVKDEPGVFVVMNGAWGKQGCTKVVLENADELTVRQALLAAWRNTAPRKLVNELDGGDS
jgi:hypothetical protein